MGLVFVAMSSRYNYPGTGADSNTPSPLMMLLNLIPLLLVLFAIQRNFPNQQKWYICSSSSQRSINNRKSAGVRSGENDKSRKPFEIANRETHPPPRIRTYHDPDP